MSDKKSTSLIPKTDSITQSENIISARKVVEVAGGKIKSGLEKPTASTGTPIQDIHGGALFMTQVSNVGGGSVATGGGGIKDGFKTLLEFTDAKATLNAELAQTTQKAIDSTNED